MAIKIVNRRCMTPSTLVVNCALAIYITTRGCAGSEVKEVVVMQLEVTLLGDMVVMVSLTVFIEEDGSTVRTQDSERVA